MERATFKTPSNATRNSCGSWCSSGTSLLNCISPTINCTTEYLKGFRQMSAWDNRLPSLKCAPKGVCQELSTTNFKVGLRTSWPVTAKLQTLQTALKNRRKLQNYKIKCHKMCESQILFCSRGKRDCSRLSISSLASCLLKLSATVAASNSMPKRRDNKAK
jgi:hypothetical protein